jgi:hypothetical protein
MIALTLGTLKNGEASGTWASFFKMTNTLLEDSPILATGGE